MDEVSRVEADDMDSQDLPRVFAVHHLCKALALLLCQSLCQAACKSSKKLPHVKPCAVQIQWDDYSQLVQVYC